MDLALSRLAQLFGAMAIGCSLIIYSRNDRKKLLIFKSIQDICWCTHYWMLGAYPAVASSALCVARSAAFYGNPKKERKSKWILVLFLALYALCGADLEKRFQHPARTQLVGLHLRLLDEGAAAYQNAGHSGLLHYIDL